MEPDVAGVRQAFRRQSHAALTVLAIDRLHGRKWLSSASNLIRRYRSCLSENVLTAQSDRRKMIPFLTVLSGLAWTIVYAESIRIGFRDKTYAMPIAALALNVAWESTYAVHDLMASVSVQAFVNLIWALADLAIVFTFFKFGRAELPSFVTRRMFAAWGVLIFGAAYAVQLLFLAQFGAHAASRYTAFLQNTLMSGLFLQMILARRGLRGQTLTIAVAKWLGTLAPTILFGVIEGSHFLLGLGILCSVFDLVYLGLVVWLQRNPNGLTRAQIPVANGSTASVNSECPREEKGTSELPRSQSGRWPAALVMTRV